MTVIAQLPFRVINDTRGLSIEYDYPMEDPQGRKFMTPMRSFLGTPENPVQPLFGPILKLMEMYRVAESRIAAFERERESLQAQIAEKQKTINSQKAQIEGLQARKKP